MQVTARVSSFGSEGKGLAAQDSAHLVHDRCDVTRFQHRGSANQRGSWRQLLLRPGEGVARLGGVRLGSVLQWGRARFARVA
jgi:hypothetical protein